MTRVEPPGPGRRRGGGRTGTAPAPPEPVCEFRMERKSNGTRLVIEVVSPAMLDAELAIELGIANPPRHRGRLSCDGLLSRPGETLGSSSIPRAVALSERP